MFKLTKKKFIMIKQLNNLILTICEYAIEKCYFKKKEICLLIYNYRF